MKEEIKIFHPATRKEWRRWLEKNHDKEKNVKLVIVRKNSDTPGIMYEDAVLEALCFGWIDSKANSRDEGSFFIHMARRSPKSKWSKPNRDRVAKLQKEGLIMPAGQHIIDLAKKSGTWKALEKTESLEIPDELQTLFNKNKTAFKNFQAFSPSARKIILGWIREAKRPETRANRIAKTVQFAAKNMKAVP